jgi:hypothetical protein
MVSRRLILQSFSAAAAFAAAGVRATWAANAPGFTEAEIKIGQTMPFSGPASSYGVIGRVEAAYFKAGSTAASSTSSAWTTATARQRPSNKPAI